MVQTTYPFKNKLTFSPEPQNTAIKIKPNQIRALIFDITNFFHEYQLRNPLKRYVMATTVAMTVRTQSLYLLVGMISKYLIRVNIQETDITSALYKSLIYII